MPPAFNLSQDQTLQFKSCVCRNNRLIVLTSFLSTLTCRKLLIRVSDDAVPTVSAHTNYLIGQFVKEREKASALPAESAHYTRMKLVVNNARKLIIIKKIKEKTGVELARRCGPGWSTSELIGFELGRSVVFRLVQLPSRLWQWSDQYPQPEPGQALQHLVQSCDEPLRCSR